jgi:agmatinase
MTYKLSVYSVISINNNDQEIWYNKITKKGVVFSKDLEEIVCKLLVDKLAQEYENIIDKNIIKIILQELIDRGLIVLNKLSHIEEVSYLENLNLCTKTSTTFFNTKYIDIENYNFENSKDYKTRIAIFGVPFDYNSPKPGSRFGPNLLRNSSTEIANLQTELIDFYFNNVELFDLGNINTHSNDFLDIYSRIEKVINYLPTGIISLMIGGDHALSYAAIKTIYNKYKYDDLILIHIDHHHDIQFWGDYNDVGPTCLTKLTHANFISWLTNDLPNLKMLHLGIQAFNHKLTEKNKNFNSDLRNNTISNLDLLMTDIKNTAESLPLNKKIYISLDIDVINHSEISCTGYPSSLGVTIPKIFELMQHLMQNNTVVGIDVMEFGLNNNYSAHQKQGELICYLILHMLNIISKKQGI